MRCTAYGLKRERARRGRSPRRRRRARARWHPAARGIPALRAALATAHGDPPPRERLEAEHGVEGRGLDHLLGGDVQEVSDGANRFPGDVTERLLRVFEDLHEELARGLVARENLDQLLGRVLAHRRARCSKCRGLPALDVVREDGEAEGDVLVSDDHVGGNGELGRGEVPDGLDAQRDDPRGDLLGRGPRHADDGDADVEAAHDARQGLSVPRIVKPPTMLPIFAGSLSKMATRRSPYCDRPGYWLRAEPRCPTPIEDGRVLVVDAEELLDGPLQAADGVAGLGLALVPDEGHVLAHLRVVDAEEPREVARGDVGLARD